ncbi:flagellar basal body rod protein FlgC [Planomonospora alba]|uniref:Flagellar basal body rod protein FlgC n=2 Tax=Planomonospora alba TaxID=161354 RepID=A0ABP6NIV9_9ACTN
MTMSGGPFRAIGIASTGVTVYRKWLDAVSDNISNLNNATTTAGEAFRERFVIAQAVDYGSGNGGVQVGGIELGSAEGRLVHEPDHPLADENGYVRYPDIDLGSQMSQLMMAQRGYQANLSVVDRAYDAYQAALQLGRNS